MREIFLKTDNLIAGRYLAEVTQQVMSDLDASKYQLVEWRVSVYGRKPSEWDKLARWFYTHRLASDKVRWLIQIPRLYAVYKASGEIDDFEHILRNIFAPLFEATRDPQSNVPLATFLETIVGFDCVDDESKPELHSNQGQRFPTPKEWTYKQDPPYSYWCYYLYANIKSLNDFRRERGEYGVPCVDGLVGGVVWGKGTGGRRTGRSHGDMRRADDDDDDDSPPNPTTHNPTKPSQHTGMSTFEFRPHCGEAGDPEHLVAAYLLADKINHGIVLRKIPGAFDCWLVLVFGVAGRRQPTHSPTLPTDPHPNPNPTPQPHDHRAAAALLPEPHRDRHVPAEQQQALPRLPPEPLRQVLLPGPQRLALHGRPAHAPLHQGPLSGGVLGGRAGLAA